MKRLVAAFVSSIVMAAPAHAIVLQRVLEGLASPVYVTNAHDGSHRLFVVEQPGRIQVLGPGAQIPVVFLDLTSRVLSGGEQGLLGLAFHPQFAANGRFFVDYTRKPDGATVIAEYRASPDPNVTAGSEKVLLVVPQPYTNHNGGMVEFGPDGYLYIGMGDGGSANDPANRAQNPDELLGKILRIDVDRSSGGLPYAIPAGNPFAGPTAGRDEIYALGFRNPFRFSFDRQTGELYVGDVGQNAIEEIDVVSAGGNYGWRVYEGTQCTLTDLALCNPANFTPPIAQYDHAAGRCAIIGGYVYRGGEPGLAPGSYVFGDLCTGEIFTLAGGVPTVLLGTSLSIASFGEDEDGVLYVVGLGGTVDRLTIRVTAPPPEPEPFNVQGLWWATPAGSESGWGINFAHQGDLIFATWYTYDASGRPWWLTILGAAIGGNVYLGQLYETHGPAFNAPFASAPVTRRLVGSGRLSFTDANNGVFTYTIDGIPTRSKAITRQVFGPLPTCTWGLLANIALATNYQDLWWAAPPGSESGWGVNLAHAGDTIFVTWLTYDFDGSPLWLSATAGKTAPGVYRGALIRSSGPPFDVVPFNPLAVTRVAVGTVTLSFTSGNSASYAYTVTLGGTAVTQTKSITRQIFRVPGTACS